MFDCLANCASKASAREKYQPIRNQVVDSTIAAVTCKKHHVGSLCSMFRQKLFARLANPFCVCQARCWTKTFRFFFSGGVTYKCLCNILQNALTFIHHLIQLFRERLSEKVHATIHIVGGLEFTVLQRNLREWHERPWTYVCECWGK